MMTHDSYPFLFFGAGDAKFYEHLSLYVEFENPLDEAVRAAVDETIPTTWQDDVEWPQENVLAVHAEWARQSISEDFPDADGTGEEVTEKQRHSFHGQTESWLRDVHSLAPIRSVFRDDDSKSGGTEFSDWHNWSLDRIEAWVPSQIPIVDGQIQHDHTSPKLTAQQRAFRAIDWELARGRAITPEVRLRRSLGWILKSDIAQRREEVIVERFHDMTPEDFVFIISHTPGGVNESIFVVADRFMDREDLPQNFWDQIGRITWDRFNEEGDAGDRVREIWKQLDGKTVKHLLAPFVSALKNKDVSQFERAMEIVPGPYDAAFEVMFARAFEPEEESHFEMAYRFAPKLFSDERDFSNTFVKFTESLSHRWTFDDRDPKVDEMAEILRSAVYFQSKAPLHNLVYKSWQCVSAENWAAALPIYYVICANQEIENSAHCNGLYVVQVDNNHSTHQPEIARKLLADCLPQAPENLDIYYNAVAVYMELDDFDNAFEMLRRVTKAGVTRDYNLDKIEKEPHFEVLRADPRWDEIWGESRGG